METEHIACAKRGGTCNRCQGKGKRATGAKRNKMRLRDVKILLVLLLLLVTVSELSCFFFVSGRARYSIPGSELRCRGNRATGNVVTVFDI